MGEIADMMLEGDLCAQCGSYIDEEGGDGFPRYCSKQCEQDAGVHIDMRSLRRGPKVPCPTCKRKVSSIGLAQHHRDAHKTPLPQGDR